MGVTLVATIAPFSILMEIVRLAHMDSGYRVEVVIPASPSRMVMFVGRMLESGIGHNFLELQSSSF